MKSRRCRDKDIFWLKVNVSIRHFYPRVILHLRSILLGFDHRSKGSLGLTSANMSGENSVNIVGRLKTLTTAAGWILAVVSAMEALALPRCSKT